MQVALSADHSSLDDLGEIDVNNEPLLMDKVLDDYGPFAVLMDGVEANRWRELVRLNPAEKGWFAYDTSDFALSYVGEFNTEHEAELAIAAGVDDVLKDGYVLIPGSKARGWI